MFYRIADGRSRVFTMLVRLKHTLMVLCSLLLFACGEHSGYEVKMFKGEYRYYAGIAEFFDCNERVKYFVTNDVGINASIKKSFLTLGLKPKDDAYIQVKGYLKPENQLQGMDPITVFVPVELVKFDKTRGCQRYSKQGR